MPIFVIGDIALLKIIQRLLDVLMFYHSNLPYLVLNIFNLDGTSGGYSLIL